MYRSDLSQQIIINLSCYQTLETNFSPQSQQITGTSNQHFFLTDFMDFFTRNVFLFSSCSTKRNQYQSKNLSQQTVKYIYK
jgi:hypothetical protein